MTKDGEDDSLYIPDPCKWRKYYKELVTAGNKKISGFATLRGEGGGSITFSTITPLSTRFPEEGSGEKGTNSYTPQIDTPVIKLVSPSEQAVEQARSEINRNPEGTATVALPAKAVSMVKRRRKRQQKSSFIVPKRKKRTQRGSGSSKKSTSKRGRVFKKRKIIVKKGRAPGIGTFTTKDIFA